jgi:hypothetical protein
MSTPVGHFATHMLTAAALAAIGWGLWWYANRGVDTEEQVAAIDTDLTAVEQDQDALWERLEEIVTWLYALAGQPMPDDGPPTEEHAAVVDEDDGPDTEVAEAADTWARKLALLHRTAQTAGRHRTESGGRTVAEISDGIETRMLTAVEPKDGSRIAR